MLVSASSKSLERSSSDCSDELWAFSEYSSVAVLHSCHREESSERKRMIDKNSDPAARWAVLTKEEKPQNCENQRRQLKERKMKRTVLFISRCGSTDRRELAMIWLNENPANTKKWKENKKEPSKDSLRS